MKKSSLKPHEGMKKGVYLLPNLCTTCSLFCGFFSVIKSLSGQYQLAAIAIMVAGVFDLLDGRIARLANAESEFGIQYDSLVDLSSFGLAPGILIYTWALSGLGKLGWLAAFLYFACGALRLARFNVQHDNVEMNYFQGLPIPIGAYVLSTFVIFYHYIFDGLPQNNIWIATMCIAVALLMVSNIRYRSMKVMHLNRRGTFFALIVVVCIIFLIAVRPEIVLFGLSITYVISGLIEELLTLHQSKKIFHKVKESNAKRKVRKVNRRNLKKYTKKVKNMQSHSNVISLSQEENTSKQVGE